MHHSRSVCLQLRLDRSKLRPVRPYSRMLYVIVTNIWTVRDFTYLYTHLSASVGGYCTLPGQCLCHSGYRGANCEVGMTFQYTCRHCDYVCNVHVYAVCMSMQLSLWGFENGNMLILLHCIMQLHCKFCFFADVTPCETQTPCEHGATCTNDGSGGYHCACRPGYEGVNCETEINECDPMPCQNGGTCTVSSFNLCGRSCTFIAHSCSTN